ncbi:MAG: hypothetical protein AAFU66_00600 [Pseudomonadota bacterium]
MSVEIGRRGERVISPDEQRSRAAVLAVARREERIAELKDALNWYAEHTHYLEAIEGDLDSVPIVADNGRRARNALSKLC